MIRGMIRDITLVIAYHAEKQKYRVIFFWVSLSMTRADTNCSVVTDEKAENMSYRNTDTLGREIDFVKKQVHGFKQ